MFGTLKTALAGVASVLPDLQATERQVELWRGKRAALLEELAQARTHETAVTLQAAATGDTEAVEEARRTRDALQNRLEVIEQTLRAAEGRLAEEQASAERARVDQAWADFEKALADRRKALVHMVKQAEALAKAIVDAEAAAVRAKQLLPVPDPWGYSDFTRLEGEVGRVLAFATDGKLGSYKGNYSEMFEDRKLPGVVERADSVGKDWLALRARYDQVA